MAPVAYESWPDLATKPCDLSKFFAAPAAPKIKPGYAADKSEKKEYGKRGAYKKGPSASDN